MILSFHSSSWDVTERHKRWWFDNRMFFNAYANLYQRHTFSFSLTHRVISKDWLWSIQNNDFSRETIYSRRIARNFDRSWIQGHNRNPHLRILLHCEWNKTVTQESHFWFEYFSFWFVPSRSVTSQRMRPHSHLIKRISASLLIGLFNFKTTTKFSKKWEGSRFTIELFAFCSEV